MVYQIAFSTKWADFDPNRHMRHTAYNDYAAEVRVRFFAEHGFSISEFAQLNIGPILFKEETNFLKEINLGDDIRVDMHLEAASKNLERWRFIHQIYNQKNELAAVVKVYGAWIDLKKRKLTNAPQIFIDIFKDLSKTVNFIEIPLKSEK